MEDFLVATHLSSLATSKPTSFVVPTIRQQLPLPQAQDQSIVHPEHAIFSSVLDTPATGTILLRLINGGLKVELVSLSAEVPPLRLVFPSVLLNYPSIFLENQDLHVLAVTEHGSLHRVIIPIQTTYLWKGQTGNIWPKEHLINNFPTDTRSCFVQAQSPFCVAITHDSGALLRLDIDSLGYDGHEEEWKETLFHHGSFLSSFASLLPSLHATHPNAADIISLATHSWPSDIPHVWTLSRDRTLRLWKARLGCVASRTLPYAAHSMESSRASSSTGASSGRNHPLLEEARQNLLKVFTINTASGDRVYVLAFVPSPASVQYGGFFTLFDTTNDQLRDIAVIECSRRTVHCHLQDFMVVGNQLVTLWETQGRSTVEKAPLDFDGYESGDIQAPMWTSSSYYQEPELTPAYMEERLVAPGSMAERFMDAIFQPGVFSSLSLRTAIDQYTEAYLSLPGNHPKQLQQSYTSLAENIAAVVGCTVVLNRDPHNDTFQYARYWIALKRDWEGFVARCREVERSARWPLALGSRGPNDIIVIERERAGAVVKQDSAIYLHRLIGQDRLNDATFDLLTISGALRKHLGVVKMTQIEGALSEMMRREQTFSIIDILEDNARKVNIWESLDEGPSSWLAGRIQSVSDLTAAARAPFDAIGALEYTVKQEDADHDLSALIPEPHSDWFRALTARYITIAVEARYELSLSIMALLLYVSRELSPRHANVVAEAFAVFRGAAMLRTVTTRSTERTAKEDTESTSPDDEVINRLRNMDMSPNRAPDSFPTSLTYLLLAQSDVGGGTEVVSHTFLDNSGLLRSVSPSYVTKFEVVFCERLRLLGFLDIARELLTCLPRTSATLFVLAQVWLQMGRFDEAAQIYEKLAGSFGTDNALSPEDVEPLQMVLPAAQPIESEFAYYVYVSELFKSHLLVRYQVQFAQLAISSAPAGLDTSSLWTIVTKGYADLGLYEEAYAAMIAMPFERQRREFAGQLALRMCEDNAVSRLMTFDFAGVSEDVEEILSFKARNVDPRNIDPKVVPNYSRILYTWYIRRGEYRSAALTMYQRALKLKESITSVQLFIEFGEEQLDSYSIAINALSLVEENSQWIILPVIPDAARSRKGSSKYIPESKFISSKHDSKIVHLRDIQQQYALLNAQISIIRIEQEILATPEFLLSPAVLLMRLAHHGCYSQALAVGSALKLDMSDLFTGLTSECIHFSRNIEAPIPPHSDWLLTDNSTTWSGSTADRAWRFLRSALERYDGVDNDYRYAKAALENILTFDRSSPPPPWLLQLIENHHPEYLVRLSLRCDNVDDAVMYLLNMLRKSDQRLAKEPFPQNASSTWMPYSLVDQVMVAASSQTKTPPLLSQLRTELSKRTTRVQGLSHKSA